MDITSFTLLTKQQQKDCLALYIRLSQKEYDDNVWICNQEDFIKTRQEHKERVKLMKQYLKIN